MLYASQNPPGGPVVSGTGGPAEKISQSVDHSTGPLGSLPTFFLGGFHPHSKYFNEVRDLPSGALLCTLDIRKALQPSGK